MELECVRGKLNRLFSFLFPLANIRMKLRADMLVSKSPTLFRESSSTYGNDHRPAGPLISWRGAALRKIDFLTYPTYLSIYTRVHPWGYIDPVYSGWAGCLVHLCAFLSLPLHVETSSTMRPNLDGTGRFRLEDLPRAS